MGVGEEVEGKKEIAGQRGWSVKKQGDETCSKKCHAQNISKRK
jgi:hypothetical protein